MAISSPPAGVLTNRCFSVSLVGVPANKPSSPHQNCKHPDEYWAKLTSFIVLFLNFFSVSLVGVPTNKFSSVSPASFVGVLTNKLS
jgi:hypothetical protein